MHIHSYKTYGKGMQYVVSVILYFMFPEKEHP